MKTGLVCFDLDDTLIRGIHSVMLPCILNRKEKEYAVIQEQEDNGQLDYIAADYLRAELFCGLCEDEIGRHFLEIARPLKGIFETVGFLHEKGVKCLLITVGPVQVARVVCQLYGFDVCYGSDYEVVDGKFTGKIVTYLRAENKVRCLEDFCRRNCIGSSECVAVGDGVTDIPVFRHCGGSIALNACDEVKSEAGWVVDTEDLFDIVGCIG